MARQDKERQERLEPKRIDRAVSELSKLGFSITQINKRVEFTYKGELVKYFPYSGWHTGKSIKDGRGFQKLLSQLR